MTVKTKICGITEPVGMDAASRFGAEFCGLNFFPPSPRYVSPDEAAMLASRARPDMMKVGVFVDPDDVLIDRVLAQVPLDMIQLHGKEDTERCAELKARTGLKIIKVVHVREADDLALKDQYRDVADWLMFDAKAPKDATRPGGNATAFDWLLLKEIETTLPWMLAGGITPDNVATAVRLTRPTVVDAASSVEAAPGKKDPAKIEAFISAAKGA